MKSGFAFYSLSHNRKPGNEHANRVRPPAFLWILQLVTSMTSSSGKTASSPMNGADINATRASKRRNVLGIHIGHDRGAALVQGGELVAQIAEERVDRRKHSNSPELPLKAISSVLDIARIAGHDLAAVGISYTNVVIGDILAQLTPEVRDFLKSPSVPVHGLNHHDCHAWSTYCTSDFDSSLILIADGAGDIVGDQVEAESLYVGENGQIRLLERRLQDFGLTRTDRRNAFNLAYMAERDKRKQISLGRKYEQFTYLLGFGHGHAGKTMALAAYGEPLFSRDVASFSGLQFSLTFKDGLDQIDEAWRRSGEPWHKFVRTQAAPIAASAQAMLEKYVTHLLGGLDAFKYQKRLCAAGGVFLNCQLNQRVLETTGFEKVHIFPAAGDDGQCVGAAFAAYVREFTPSRWSSKALPYLGPEHVLPRSRRGYAILD